VRVDAAREVEAPLNRGVDDRHQLNPDHPGTFSLKFSSRP
jgi:hypothetical protein